MDTAKVDIRKLQLLSDRVNQCIDALNQVRLSVHGLAHASQGIPGVVAQTPLAQDPRLAGFAVASPFGASPLAAGLAHSNPIGAAMPLGTPIAGAAIPWGGVSPYAALGHTSAEGFEGIPRPMWADPYLASRIAQTFPYATAVVPPVVTIY